MAPEHVAHNFVLQRASLSENRSSNASDRFKRSHDSDGSRQIKVRRMRARPPLRAAYEQLMQRQRRGPEGAIAFATVVFGRKMRFPCLAAVLGAALQKLQPTVPRLAVVDTSLSPASLGILSSTWTLHRLLRDTLSPQNRKEVLWTLPYRSVLFMDADSYPVVSDGRFAHLNALRVAKLEKAWSSTTPSGLLAHRMRVNTARGCFNGGLLLLRTDAAVRHELERARKEKPWQSPGKHLPPCTAWGFDQPPLHAVFALRERESPRQDLNTTTRVWSELSDSKYGGLKIGDPYTCNLKTSNHSDTLATERFHTLDVFQAWGNSAPLGLHSCGLKRTRLGLPCEGLPPRFPARCAEVHTEFARMWWKLFLTLPLGTRRECLGAYDEPDTEHPSQANEDRATWLF